MYRTLCGMYNTYIHAYILYTIYIHGYMPTYLHPYTHTYIHTYIHTYTHIHPYRTYTLTRCKPPRSSYILVIYTDSSGFHWLAPWNSLNTLACRSSSTSSSSALLPLYLSVQALFSCSSQSIVCLFIRATCTGTSTSTSTSISTRFCHTATAGATPHRPPPTALPRAGTTAPGRPTLLLRLCLVLT